MVAAVRCTLGIVPHMVAALAARDLEQLTIDGRYPARVSEGTTPTGATLATAVREARARAAVDRERLARRSGVPVGRIADIEDGTTEPTVGEVDALLTSLAVRLVGSVEPLEPGLEPDRLAQARALTPGARLARAGAWNRFAAALAAADLRPARPRRP